MQYKYKNKIINGISLLVLTICVFNSVISNSFFSKGIIESVSAYTINDKNTFDEYKQKIELLSTDLERDYKVNGKLSTTNLDTLKNYINKAIETFPNNNDYIYNNNIAKNLLISIDVVKKSPTSDTKISEMAKNLSDFITKTKIQRIQASLKSFPQSGSAPLTTTLRAENVFDPSGVILPQSNYVWWIKQSDGSRKVLGNGPAITYTFREEKSYLVYLDITSASRNNNGKIDVLPYSGQIKIDVLPSLGNIYLYINGVNVSELDKIKITPNIGKAGLVIDATESQPVGGSKFVRTSWNFGNTNSTSYDYSPRIEKQYYVSEGTYKLTLNILTNENKNLTKDIFIDVRNPVASIKLDKSIGFVGDEFKMGISTAFYDGKLSYEWKITELGSDQSTFSSSQENFTYKFKKTGKFAIKLKSIAPSGREDTDLVVVNIESRDPIATFESNIASPETPNTYKFDASSSFDPDTFDGSKLILNWQVDGEKVELENPIRNGAIGKYTFNTEGNHKVVLEVSNKSGKTTTIKKDINITSLLSVKMNFSPKIVKMNTPLVIVAESKEASVFEWSFGDGTTDLSNNGRIVHVYKKSGVYDILLNVRGKKNGDSNSISRKIYVSDGDSPVANITLTRDNEEMIVAPNACDGQDAFMVDRAGIINFSGENSANIDGNNAGLIYSWKYMDKNSSQPKFSYKIDELGCFPISLTVKSQKNGKINTIKTFAKVENLPPKVVGLTITAPDTKSDPVIVKVTANNPHDDDGVIVSYLWYYYTDSDQEPQDYRVTKMSETTFVLPKVTGKYYFVLIIEDSNGAKVNTENLSDEKYSIQLATDNMNTPIIKLNADKTSISSGDEVNFDISVSDILGKDISDKVEYKYDYDGDGFYDDTSKTGKITHKFSKSGNVNFKVKVTYKGISNTKYQLISVKNILKPNFEYYAIGKKLVLFNTSVGTYTSSTWDLGNNITSTNLHSFTYDFKDETFPTDITLKVGDGSSFQSITIPVRKDVINQSKVSKSSDKLIMFTYPKIEDGILHITKNDSKAFIYLGESKGEITTYCIDSDTKTDSNLNGTPDDDCDNKGMDSYTNGSPYTISDFDSNFKERNIKVSIYNAKNLIEEKKFNIILDYLSNSDVVVVNTADNKDISENDRKGIEELKDLIKKSPEKDRLKMSQFLSSLQENWFDDREKTKTVIDFESYVNTSLADQKLKDQFFNVLEGLLIEQSQVKDEVALAAKVLRALIPKSNPNYAQIQKNIDDILSHPTNSKLNKDLGTFILDSIKNDSNITNKDKVIIKSQLQVIIYGSQKNIPEDVAAASVSEATGQSSGIIGFVIGVAKWFFYIILLFIALLLGLFTFFKVTNKNDNLSFQDFLIELFLKTGKAPETEVVEFKKQTQQEQKEQQQQQADILSSISSAPIVDEVKSSSQKDEQIMSNITNYEPESSHNSQLNTQSSSNTDLPDWLKGATPSEPVSAPIETKEETVVEAEIIPTELPKEEEIKTEVITQSESPKSNFIEETLNGDNKSELPAWLKGLDQDNLKQELKQEFSGEQLSPNLTEIAKEETVIVPEETKVNSENDLPDWLKGSASTAKIIKEEPVIIKEEKNIDTPDSVLTNSSSSDNVLEIKNDDSKIEKKKQVKKTNKDLFEDVSNQIKSPKPVAKKPKILEGKNEDKILNQNNDDLPDWLK
ncbi:MAG: PKD domain-containing protein [Candidatus Gracilibacteria bacterium]|nr:PKD domain-containing protein [Candidatus Gracilibacteria bacterium]MDD2908285.1 PKD domain-containing protein [Candidatus Gracilibacteria bacterium]